MEMMTGVIRWEDLCSESPEYLTKVSKRVEPDGESPEMLTWKPHGYCFQLDIINRWHMNLFCIFNGALNMRRPFPAGTVANSQIAHRNQDHKVPHAP